MRSATRQRKLWPYKSGGLPPGQRRLDVMPRFSDMPFNSPPNPLPQPVIEVRRASEVLATIDHALIESIGPRDFTRDFHCVTTWSVVGLVWTGVPLAEVLVAAEIAQQDTEFVVVRSADQGRANFVWDDFDSSSIFVATHLNGQALDARTGGPLRLVAPDRYGYKSVKHLTSFDLRRDEPRLPAKEHLRARVALEERHPKISTRLLRYGYRAMIPPTALAARRSMR